MARRDRWRRIAARFVARPEPAVDWRLNLKHGIGAFLAVLLLGALLIRTDLPLLVPPFGASTLLLFARPSSPLAQPANVIGGYLIAVVSAYACAALFPGVLWATAAALGVSITAMSRLRVTHPPAGAIPLIAFADPLSMFAVMEAIAIGVAVLLILATLYHMIPPRQRYPDPTGG